MKTLLIGFGYWPAHYVRILEDIAPVSDCVEPNDQRRASLESEYKNIRFHETIYDFMESFEGLAAAFEIPSIAIVCSPAETHYKVTKDLLYLDMHVLCEKPIALKVRDLELLEQEAKNKNLVLMQGLTYLFNTKVHSIKSILEGVIKIGEFDGPGGILCAHSTRTNLGPVRSDVDALTDLAVHDLSIISLLFGDIETTSLNIGKGFGFFTGTVSGTLLTSVKTGAMQLTKDLCIRARHNFTVICFASWLEPQKTRVLRIVCDNFMIEFNELDPEPLKVYSRKTGGLLYSETKETDPESEPLRIQVLEFLDRVEHSKKKPVCLHDNAAYQSPIDDNIVRLVQTFTAHNKRHL